MASTSGTGSEIIKFDDKFVFLMENRGNTAESDHQMPDRGDTTQQEADNDDNRRIAITRRSFKVDH